MERTKFYKGLNVDQVSFAASLSEADFTRWATKGEQNPILLNRTTFDAWLRAGGHPRALNQIVENARARAHVGQTYAQNDGFSLIVPGLKTMKLMASNETITDLWTSTLKQFTARFPQFVDCPENGELMQRFVAANRAALPDGLTIAPSVAAWEAFFKTCFSRLYLRKVTKAVTEAGAPLRDTAGTAQSLKVTPGPNEAYNPLLYADIQRKQKQNAQARAAKESRERSPYARPVLESILVETILSPADVMNLSADETSVMMQPMLFPSTTDSADDWTKSESFIAETPARQTRAQREQTQAQIEREITVFCQNYPEYERYASDAANFDGLNKTILEKIDSWGLLITATSLLDGFNWAASEGLIPKAVDRADGRVATFHVTPDQNPPPQKTRAGDIVYRGKRVSKMSSDELQTAMNESPALRDAIDAAV
jgi:hypothetical protein